jgi:hypothetical protein
MIGAYMDENAFYDEEFYYDGPVGTGKGTMAKIALNISGLSPFALEVRTQSSLTAITENPTVFTGATTVLADGSAAVLALKTQNDLVNNLVMQLGEARAERDVQAGLVAAYYANDLAGYVTRIAVGQASVILAANMDVFRPAVPAPPMSRVQNLRLTPSSDSGAAYATWDVVYYSRSYEVQISATPEVEASWKAYKSAFIGGTSVTAQPSGQRCFVRVRACNNASLGEWSEPVGCMIA